MAEYCLHCGHGWAEHHTLATTATDADGKPNAPKGTVIPCDECGCTRWYGRIMVPAKWLVTWSSSTDCGSETVVYPDHLRRDEVIRRYESAHYGCYVDRLESRGSEVEA